MEVIMGKIEDTPVDEIEIPDLAEDNPELSELSAPGTFARAKQIANEVLREDLEDAYAAEELLLRDEIFSEMPEEHQKLNQAYEKIVDLNAQEISRLGAHQIDPKAARTLIDHMKPGAERKFSSKELDRIEADALTARALESISDDMEEPAFLENNIAELTSVEQFLIKLIEAEKAASDREATTKIMIVPQSRWSRITSNIKDFAKKHIQEPLSNLVMSLKNWNKKVVNLSGGAEVDKPICGKTSEGSFAISADRGAGRKYKLNQDSCLVQETSNGTALVLSDGAGGHGGGLAGMIASTAIIKGVYRALTGGKSLKAAIEEDAKEQLRQDALKHEIPELGATLVATMIKDRKLDLLTAGDSSCIIVRDGRLLFEARQDSFDRERYELGVASLEEVLEGTTSNIMTNSIFYKRGVVTGYVRESYPTQKDLRRFQNTEGIPAATFRLIDPDREIEAKEGDDQRINLEPGDQVLLFSDGLPIDATVIAALIKDCKTPEEMLTLLREEQRENQALGLEADDNISMVALIVA